MSQSLFSAPSETFLHLHAGPLHCHRKSSKGRAYPRHAVNRRRVSMTAKHLPCLSLIPRANPALQPWFAKIHPGDRRLDMTGTAPVSAQYSKKSSPCAAPNSLWTRQPEGTAVCRSVSTLELATQTRLVNTVEFIPYGHLRNQSNGIGANAKDGAANDILRIYVFVD